MEKAILRILLADDDEVDRLLFQEALEELKIELIIHTVNNGIELMNYLFKKDALLPNLIFLDLNMPRKNGLECLKDIRGNKMFNRISIVIYSTSSSERDITETFRFGANAYMKKPNDFNVLKQILNKTIKTSHLFHESPPKMRNYLLII